MTQGYYSPPKKLHDLPEVIVKNGDIDRAIKLFIKRWRRSGIISELKRRRDHPSAGDRKRRKELNARRRRVRANRR